MAVSEGLIGIAFKAIIEGILSWFRGERRAAEQREDIQESVLNRQRAVSAEAAATITKAMQNAQTVAPRSRRELADRLRLESFSEGPGNRPSAPGDLPVLERSIERPQEPTG